MSLKDQLASIFDVFSHRSPARGKGYKPDEFPEQVRRRILILYRDVVAGQWQTNEWSSPGNHTAEFWAEVHNSLEHLYGRVRLSSAATNTQMDDAIAFVLHGTPAEFFDFLELSFRVESMWRILHEKNDLVDAINEIFRVEHAPYQLTRVVTREEPGTGRFRQGTTIHTVAWPRVIRVEDEVTYAEAVAPALWVLSASHFEAANLEFRDALDEYP